MSLFLLLCACSDYDLYREKNTEEGSEDTGSSSVEGEPAPEQDECALDAVSAEEVGVGDACAAPPEGGFAPVVEWSYGSFGQGCLALPVAADLDQDGDTEIILNITSGKYSGYISC